MNTRESEPNLQIKLAFEPETIKLSLAQIFPLKKLRPGTKESKKYAQIVRSVQAIGLVEAPVVARDKRRKDAYYLLDGHLRVEALKDLGINEVECLVSTDDEAYTYNKRVNRLAAVQEHRMIVRAVDRGVPPEQIAQALALDVEAVRRRFRLLDGICPEAVELLRDTTCPMVVFELLRQMAPIRQVEAAELMIGQSNFSSMFARALLAATHDKQLRPKRKRKSSEANSVTSGQIAKIERELSNLQMQVKSIEESYGLDNLHLTCAKGYVTKLLGNARVVRWLVQFRQEYLNEFQSIAEIENIGTARTAAE